MAEKPENVAKQAKSLDELIALAESEEDEEGFDERFCGALIRHFDSELASILDYDESSRVLRFRYSMDLSEKERSRFFIRLGEGVSGTAVYARRTIAVENAMEVSETSAYIARETGRTIGTLLAAPAIRKGRCVAVIEILNRRGGAFTDEEGQTLRMLSVLYALRRPAPPRAAIHRGKSGRFNLPEENAIIGASAVVESALRIALRAATTDVPVLILGESGTGKELFAHRIHEASSRSDRPYVAINCAALSETLLESELFGHTRGAFTGADKARRGRLEEAESGTVFLDEIGDMSAACQAKLLRTLDKGEICPVGSNETRRIDVRFIAATNRPLEAMVSEGKFRGDLYYRLCGVDLRLPPLRERRDDIPLLAEIFLRRAALSTGRTVQGFDPDALVALQNYPWPGNVRELRNTIERMALMTDQEKISLQDLPPALRAGEPAPSTEDEFTQRLMQVLRETAYAGTGRWNIAEAARRLGIPRKTLDYKLRKIGVKRDG